MPCPISTCGMINVTAPVRSIRINAFGENWGSSDTPSLAPRADGTANSRNNPPPAAAPTWRKYRRPNAHIGSAPTDIPGHCGVDIGVSRMRCRPQKRASGHDLTRLTVAALHDLGVEPSLLNTGT